MYCSPGASTAKLVGIQEKETCNYTLTIQTPLLCSHPLLDPSSGSKPHLLSCAPLLSQEEYQKHLEEEGISLSLVPGSIAQYILHIGAWE